MARFATVLFVLMLVMVTDTGVMIGEARTCQSPSQRYRGPCVRNSNCASVCQTEGFSDGDCKGFRRRCFCTGHC